MQVFGFLFVISRNLVVTHPGELFEVEKQVNIFAVICHCCDGRQMGVAIGCSLQPSEFLCQLVYA